MTLPLANYFKFVFVNLLQPTFSYFNCLFIIYLSTITLELFFANYFNLLTMTSLHFKPLQLVLHFSFNYFNCDRLAIDIDLLRF